MGMKTDTSTTVMPTMAPVIWPMALRVASSGAQALPVDHQALDVFDHHDGIVHQDADGQHHAKHRQHVDGEACITDITPKVPSRATGTTSVGISV